MWQVPGSAGQKSQETTPARVKKEGAKEKNKNSGLRPLKNNNSNDAELLIWWEFSRRIPNKWGKHAKRWLKIQAPNIQFSNPKYSNVNDLQLHVHWSKNKKKENRVEGVLKAQTLPKASRRPRRVTAQAWPHRWLEIWHDGVLSPPV